jgi:hypothetical protein
MTLIMMLGGLLAATVGASGAQAAAIHHCSFSQGGSFHHVTTRRVSCAKARAVVKKVLDPRPCWPSERRLGSCHYRRGVWSVRGRWFRDRHGADQLDLRATASRGRVVRFQTDWDGE